MSRITRAIFAAAFFLIAPAAFAAYETIPGNPLTIYVSDDGSYQSVHASHPGNGQFYPTDSTLGDAGWFFRTSTPTLFAPDLNGADHSNTAASNLGARTIVTPISMTTLTGTGVAADPYTVVAVVDLGTTGLTATITTTYVDGDEHFTQKVELANNSGASETVNIFFGADIYLAADDDGIPSFYPSHNTVGGSDCNARNYNILLIPLTPMDFYTANNFGNVWSQIGSGALDNSVASGCIDNGAALQWDRTIDDGDTVTIESQVSFGANPFASGTPAPVPALPAGLLAILALAAGLGVMGRKRLLSK
jgi:hypothetical protein